MQGCRSQEEWRGAGAMVPPDFGRLVNPVSTKGAGYAHYINTPLPLPFGLSNLPTSLPFIQKRVRWKICIIRNSDNHSFTKLLCKNPTFGPSYSTINSLPSFCQKSPTFEFWSQLQYQKYFTKLLCKSPTFGPS